MTLCLAGFDASIRWCIHLVDSGGSQDSLDGHPFRRLRSRGLGTIMVLLPFRVPHASTWWTAVALETVSTGTPSETEITRIGSHDGVASFQSTANAVSFTLSTRMLYGIRCCLPSEGVEHLSRRQHTEALGIFPFAVGTPRG